MYVWYKLICGHGQRVCDQACDRGCPDTHAVLKDSMVQKHTQRTHAHSCHKPHATADHDEKRPLSDSMAITNVNLLLILSQWYMPPPCKHACGCMTALRGPSCVVVHRACIRTQSHCLHANYSLDIQASTKRISITIERCCSLAYRRAPHTRAP